MQSPAKNVTTYLKEVSKEHHESLSTLRTLCLDILAGYEEGMDYGMPCYKKGDTVEVAFASQKQYVALYVLKKEALDKNRNLLEGLSVGKGCIRYRRPEKINFEVVKKLLSDTVALPDVAC